MRKSQTGNEKLKLPKAYEEALKKAREMSVEEGFATLVDSGIYTKDGQLTKNYKRKNEKDRGRA